MALVSDGNFLIHVQRGAARSASTATGGEEGTVAVVPLDELDTTRFVGLSYIADLYRPIGGFASILNMSVEDRKAWFNDSVMVTYLHIAAAHSPKNTYVVGTNFDLGRVQKIERAQLTHKLARNADLVLFPRHINTNHWILGYCVKRGDTYTAAIYDSMYTRSTNASRYTQSQSVMTEFMKKILEKDVQTGGITGDPLQTNEVDCGLYVIKYAERLMNVQLGSTNIDTIQDHRQQARRDLYNVLRQWALQPIQPIVQPYGVLGIQLIVKSINDPDHPGQQRNETQQKPHCEITRHHIIVDPAGLHFIKSNTTRGAGYASQAIYDVLGGMTTFPSDVRASITQVGQAKYHTYGNGLTVIHVAGPNLDEIKKLQPFLDLLRDAYKHVLQQFIAFLKHRTDITQKVTLHLPPISGGVFGGRLTPLQTKAQRTKDCYFQACQALSHDNQSFLLQKKIDDQISIDLCIYEASELDEYKKAFGQ